jgi:hypothetical protein
MGHSARLSRREILETIPILSCGALLLPSRGEAQTGAAGVIHGALRDGASGKPVAAKIRVTAADSGEAYMPASCIRSMPKRNDTNVRYFYARGAYEVAVPPGRYQIEVVRGICHEAGVVSLEVAAGARRRQDFDIAALRDMRAAGWYSGNTHTHYNVDIEEGVDDRMRMVPPAEALDVSVISYLIRNRLPYASNRIPIGRLPEFSRDGTLMDMGEECRNNTARNSLGYGHCLFLNIPRLVEPVSTGMLSADGQAPDFPTMSMLCAEARKLGGTAVWCHNGTGMETPIAVALGHVDALNIADGFPVGYDWYYHFLNCGLRLPVSTGTDWWEYDHNRVFARVEGEFTYESWLAGLRAGRTVISNGPLLDLRVEGKGPGAELRGVSRVKVLASALSRVRFERLEVLRDGEVIAQQTSADQREARVECEAAFSRSGWIAARVTGQTRTRTGFPVFAHTGPVYVKRPQPSARQGDSARRILAQIDDSVVFIRKYYRFASQADQALALGQFARGREFYARLAASG